MQMPYKDPTSPAAIESARNAGSKYERTHREERRRQKRERYWAKPAKARQRTKETRERFRVEGRCTRCGKLSDYKSLCSKCWEKQAEDNKKWRKKIRAEAFAAYGGPKCACCDEDMECVLELDHVDGGGG